MLYFLYLLNGLLLFLHTAILRSVNILYGSNIALKSLMCDVHKRKKKLTSTNKQQTSYVMFKNKIEYHYQNLLCAKILTKYVISYLNKV